MNSFVNDLVRKKNMNSAYQETSLQTEFIWIFLSIWSNFFPGKYSIQFLVIKMQIFRKSVLPNCIAIFDAEQVYLKPQVTNVKNKEVTANPKHQLLEKN